MYAHFVSERSPGNGGCLVDVVYVDILGGVPVEVSLHRNSWEKIIKGPHVTRLHQSTLGYLTNLKSIRVKNSNLACIKLKQMYNGVPAKQVTLGVTHDYDLI